MIQLRIWMLGFTATCIASGCGAADGRVCSPVNSWASPVFACEAAPAPVAAPEPEVAEPPPPPPEPAPEPEEKVVVKGEKIEIADKVQFETGKATLLDESKGLLDQVAKVIKDNPDIERVRVEGHTDNVGARGFNKNLSVQRARAVRAYLIEQGVEAKRLTAEGYGMDKPIASNDTEEGRYQNRRVEFTILKRKK